MWWVVVGGWHKLWGTRECELLELSRDPRCRRYSHRYHQPASQHPQHADRAKESAPATGADVVVSGVLL